MSSVVVGIAVWSSAAVAGPRSIEDEPLVDLLDLMDDRVDEPTSVADDVARSQREASAVVTVISGDELRRLGARDLIDALLLIPSVDLSGDLWNTTSLSVRGGSGERVLVLVDGHPWNDMFYGLTTFGNRLPASLIERIEVIRGPGSAVYGQNAMFAVVRVTTVGSEIEGGRVDLRASVLPSGAYGRQDVSASAGAALGDDGHVGVSAVLGRGRRSDQTYTDVYGGSFDLTDHSALNPAFVSASFDWKGLEVALAAEQYRATWRDGGAKIYRQDHDNWFSGMWGRVSYTGRFSEDLGFRTWLTSRFDEPWRSTRGFSEQAYGYFRDRGDRTATGFEVQGRLGRPVRVVAGGEGGLEHARSMEPDVDPLVGYEFGAAWGEVGVESKVVDVLAGARWDVNTAFGDALSPRLVVGEAWRRFHYKAAVNSAFRAPGFVHARSDVVAETSITSEAELGVGPTAWSYLTGTVYTNRLDLPMLYRYSVDPETGVESEGYVNGSVMRTSGAELDLQLQWGPVSASVGWAGVVAGHPPMDWRVPGVSGRMLATPANKGVLRASWDSGERLTFGGVGTWLGPRWTIPTVTADDVPVYDRLSASVVLDLSVEVRHLGLRGLSAGLSVHDLLNVNPPLLQSYDDLHAPLPGTGREILLDLRLER